jgi:hypothetical protein
MKAITSFGVAMMAVLTTLGVAGAVPAIAEAPGLSLSPATELLFKMKESQPVTIENSGDVPIKIVGEILGGSNFFEPLTSCIEIELDPGEKCAVKFKCISAGKASYTVFAEPGELVAAITLKCDP